MLKKLCLDRHLLEILVMKCGGILIISENEDHTLFEDRTLLFKQVFNV
ncbi:hypothetical protein [Romboutsia weinsteinii]|nr:hypothetical protein [Romboutsia weinsteinii]